MSNYRGITVGPVFAKLFAMIIERRLASWAEVHGVKARGQVGFRKNYRTTDNVFVLRPLIDKQKKARQEGGGGGKLYCCFVDFKNTVPRALLWQVLEDLGVQGRLLDIIKSMYAHECAAVRTSEGLSEIFRCFVKVKQGCPLSPTLFGLYVDGLEKHLLETNGTDAPELGGNLAPLLLYADDLILMSTSPEGLQRQLDSVNNASSQSISARQRLSSLKPESLTARNFAIMVQLWSVMMSTDTLVLCFMPQKTWHMALSTWWLLGQKRCMPCDGVASTYNCLILPPYASCLTFWYYPF